MPVEESTMEFNEFSDETFKLTKTPPDRERGATPDKFDNEPKSTFWHKLKSNVFSRGHARTNSDQGLELDLSPLKSDYNKQKGP